MSMMSSAAVASITPIIRLQNAKFQRDTGVTDLTCIWPASKIQQEHIMTEATVYSLPLLYWTNVEYNMGLVAGSMGSLRPLVVKLLGHISSLSHNTTTSKSGESGSKVAQNRSPWRARGSASQRVQGDSILQTGLHEEVLPIQATTVPMEAIDSKAG